MEPNRKGTGTEEAFAGTAPFIRQMLEGSRVTEKEGEAGQGWILNPCGPHAVRESNARGLLQTR